MTAKNDRSMLLILLRWAYDERIVDEYPRGIAKIKANRPPTRAWTLEQCCTAVKGSHAWRGRKFRSGADKGEFLECWLRLGYSTGARYGDLMKLHRKHFVGNRVYFSQNKTKTPINKSLPQETMQAVAAMLAKSPDGTVLGWACRKRWAMRLMKKLLRDCGLEGTSKWLRRTAATLVEKQAKGTAKIFLGHKTDGVADRNYIDWGQIDQKCPDPPRLIE